MTRRIEIIIWPFHTDDFYGFYFQNKGNIYVQNMPIRKSLSDKKKRVFCFGTKEISKVKTKHSRNRLKLLIIN